MTHNNQTQKSEIFQFQRLGGDQEIQVFLSEKIPLLRIE